ncbi:MAG: glucose-1-phosphate cytidylyltransferase [Gammaproteobacteria bacterium]|nr:glucose-1-phosphate cytidylyltransferase [Gammaproteobacteria bacterium]
MKAMILAGGMGTRITEESSVRPKPMVEIGNMPILWHIMKIYASHGINDFVICCGYKGHIIKEWFSTYALHRADVTFDLARKETVFHRNDIEPWKITLVDTGENTMTGGRIKRALPYIGGETFCLTYGDGVGNVDVARSIEFHRSHGKMATMTAVLPEGRFGAFSLGAGESMVATFREKPRGDGAWVNGGFFVVEPSVVKYITGDDSVWERDPLQTLAESGELGAYKHHGFWWPMDTLRDKQVLQSHWDSGNAPWKTWD